MKHIACVVGIDPGLSGAIVNLTLEASGSMETRPKTGWRIVNAEALVMPKTPTWFAGRDEVDVPVALEWIENVAGVAHTRGVALEWISPRPSRRMTPQAAMAIGANWGGLRRGLEAAGYQLELVYPQTWRARICPSPRGSYAGSGKAQSLEEENAEDKARKKQRTEEAIAACKRRLPMLNLLATERSYVPHDGIAEAGCIALWKAVQVYPTMLDAR